MPGPGNDAPLLVSVMKENAALKLALAQKCKDVLAAEHALVLLVGENDELSKVRLHEAAAMDLRDLYRYRFSLSQQLARSTSRVGEVEEECDRKIRDLGRELEKAEDTIARGNAQLDEQAAEIHQLRAALALPLDARVQGLHASITALLKANAALDKENKELRGVLTAKEASKHDQDPVRKVSSRSRESSVDSRAFGDEESLSQSTDQRPSSEPESSRHESKPSYRDRPYSPPPYKPVSERLRFNIHMAQLPSPTGPKVHRSGFDRKDAVQTVHGAKELFKSHAMELTTRQRLYLPKRTLWCGTKPVHALAYAPSHEYFAETRQWREHRQLVDLVSSGAEVDFFVNVGEVVHYAGVYRVISLCGVMGYAPPTRIPNSEISRSEIEQAMNLRDAERDNMCDAYPFPLPGGQGRVNVVNPRVECFGLRFVRYDEEVQRMLVTRFDGFAPSATVGKKRKYNPLSSGTGDEAPWRHAKIQRGGGSESEHRRFGGMRSATL
ncbi:hypothetical protein C8F01DRAFT_1134374 [Mycena amicta]|nr:hypothetical protein C8F01DRAFT_1134374 [Mycena amicta]